MCGIGVVLTSATTNLENHAAYTQQIRSGIRNRGPDSFGEMELMENRATFMGAVLHMRGTEVQKQPRMNDRGDVFLWNGEVFGGIEVLPKGS